MSFTRLGIVAALVGGFLYAQLFGDTGVKVGSVVVAIIGSIILPRKERLTGVGQAAIIIVVAVFAFVVFRAPKDLTTNSTGLWVLISTALIFAPTVIASLRAHRNTTAIFVFNLLMFGAPLLSAIFAPEGPLFLLALIFAVVGWLITTVWAFTANREDLPVISKIDEAPPRNCLIRIIRGSGYADRFRSYIILANDAEVGSIARNSVLDFRVPEGPLSIEARMDCGRSATLTVEATPNHRIEIEVSNYWGVALGLWATTFGSGSYLILKQVPSALAREAEVGQSLAV